jgi:hypothetical protein
MTVAVGTGKPVGSKESGIKTEPTTGGPWLKMWMFEIGTVARNPAIPFTGLTCTTLVEVPIDWIDACCGMLNATNGSGAAVLAVPDGADGVAVEEEVDVVGVVEAVFVVGELWELMDVMPETCCEPIRELNAGEPNRR